jgi:ribose/xylose/arabinose/galactoside ABC-type transport system permease subunit
MSSTASNRTGPRRQVAGFLLSQSGFLIAFIVVLSIVITLMNRNFIKPQNIINVLGQISMVGIVAVGVGLVLISGDFDISVGSQVSLNGAVLAILLTRTGNVPLAVGVVILLGAALGAVNGLIVSKSKCASFIMTLGTRSAYHGLVLVLTRGRNFPLRGTFESLGRGALGGVIPLPIVIFFLVLLFAFFLMRYTRFGRTLFAVGGNPKAAYLSGVNNDAMKIAVYTLCGLLVALASMTLISKLGASYPNTGDGYELEALAAIVVGGTSLAGGKGSALGLFLGVIIFGLMSNALNMMNVSPYFRDVFIGGIIIVATVLSRIGEGKK